MARTILVVDDHQLFAMGVQAMVGTLPETLTCEIFGDGNAAVSAVEDGTISPSLMLVDYYIPGSHSPDLVRRLRAALPHVPLLMISASHNPADIQSAMVAGAQGFINKAAAPQDILNAISDALAGRQAKAVPAVSASAQVNLTPRQLEIVQLASKGLTNKEIAKFLSVSPETIKSHMKRVFEQLGVGSRVEALDALRLSGLI